MTGSEIRQLVKKEIKNNYGERFEIKKLIYKNGELIGSYKKDITDSFIDMIITIFQEKIMESLALGNQIEIRNFMTFYIKETKRSVFVNPKNMEKLNICGKKHVRVREGIKLQKLLSEFDKNQ